MPNGSNPSYLLYQTPQLPEPGPKLFGTAPLPLVCMRATWLRVLPMFHRMSPQTRSSDMQPSCSMLIHNINGNDSGRARKRSQLLSFPFPYCWTPTNMNNIPFLLCLSFYDNQNMNVLDSGLCTPGVCFLPWQVTSRKKYHIWSKFNGLNPVLFSKVVQLLNAS